MKIILLALCCCFLSFSISAQKKNAAYTLPIRETSSVINIDGVQDELAWQEARCSERFFYGAAHGYQLCEGPDRSTNDLR